MKKKLVFLLILCLLLVTDVYAGRGCCSSHGGVVGCSPSGRQVCADGTYSPSCTCTPSTPSVPADVYGCTDKKAKNYDSEATKDDVSCLYQKKVEGKKKIPYVVQYQEDSTLKENEKIVIQKGIDGTKKVYYLITYDENNRETGREVDHEEVLVPSVAQVVKVNHVYDYDSLDNNTQYNALLSYIYL